MALFPAGKQGVVEAAARLVYCNPFVHERIECEKRILGDDHAPDPAQWVVPLDKHGDDPGDPGVTLLDARIRGLAEHARKRLLGGAAASDTELEHYERLALYSVYHGYRREFQQIMGEHPGQRAAPVKAGFYDRFVADAQHFFGIPGARSARLSTLSSPLSNVPHVFACCFQIRRAFHHIFAHIIGDSRPIMGLRAAIWQSIFSHDMGRYRRTLYDKMGDITTLITGPSGTGKELVARAIGLSRYLPFDPRTRSFAVDAAGSFYALNLSALSPTLIESELFGHRRGAFTGAVGDRVGWLETCPSLGAVFLDEIGDLDPAIQVKLLRVLQTRRFQRIGDTRDRAFAGKIIAATNRNLLDELHAGRFRADFYYRLCSDIITTPLLRDQIADHPGDLRQLIVHVARRIVGDEAEGVADEVEAWVHEKLGDDYPWPGNVRELEQCVRNVLIRHEYHPPRPRTASETQALVAAPAETTLLQAPAPQHASAALAAEMATGKLTADQLLRRYCTLVYARTRSYERAARRLGLDRRTVKAKVDPALLAELQGGAPGPGET